MVRREGGKKNSFRTNFEIANLKYSNCLTKLTFIALAERKSWR